MTFERGDEKPSPPGQARNPALDITKGLLVASMLIHHAMDYFAPGMALHRYVRFVTGAFPLLAGFVISNVSLRKHASVRGAAARRCLLRGFRLVVLFVVLNLLLAAVTGGAGARGMDDVYAVFVSGDPAKSAFDILLPIAYTVAVCGVLTLGAGAGAWGVRLSAAAALGLLAWCSAAFLEQRGGYNVRFLAIGLCGFALGFIPRTRVDALLRRVPLVLCAFTGLVIIAAIIRFYYPLYVAYTIVTAALLYSLGLAIARHASLSRLVARIGMYSLFAYVAQIGFFQALARMGFVSESWPKIVRFLTALALVTLATWLLVESLAWARKRLRTIDWTYRTLFG